MIFIYPIGIPLFYFVCLWFIRKLIVGVESDEKSNETVVKMGRDSSRLSTMKFDDLSNSSSLNIFSNEIDGRFTIERSCLNPVTSPYSSLFGAYKPDFWYWECIECVRRLSLTGLLVFMYPGSEKQVLLAMLICMFWIMVYLHVQPYLYHAHNKILISAQWGILLQLFAIYLIINQSFNSSTSTIGGLAVLVGVVIPFLYVAGNFNVKSDNKSLSLSWMEKMRIVVEEEKGESGPGKEVEMGRN